MAMYLGEDKVASLGSICNVLGNASKNLFDAYKYSENKTHTGNVSKYSIINPNEIEISYINGWSRLVLTLTGLEPNTDYTISAYLDKSNFITSVGSGFYALDNYQDNAFTKGSGNVYFTFTSSSTGTFDMWFYGNWSGTNYSGSVIYKNIQLEKGSVTEYEKYFEPTISIKDSKGDYHEVPYMTGKVSKNLLSVWEQGGITGTTGALFTSTVRIRTSNFISVTPNTDYFVSVQDETYRFLNIIFYDKNSNYVGEYYNNVSQSISGANRLKVVFPSNCYKIKVTLQRADGGNLTPSDIATARPQLEKGSNATEYEEYFEPIILIRNSNGILQEVINVDRLRPVILYNNSAGTTGNVTLGDNVSNYNELEIFGYRGGRSTSIKIRTNQTYFVLSHNRVVDGSLYTYIKEFSISGNILNVEYSKIIWNKGGTNFSVSDDSSTYITKVVGYK